MPTVFIGHDSRAPNAVKVCEASMRAHGLMLDIQRLSLEKLRASGIYWREHEVRDGRLHDVISDAPMSTEFGFTRFLVPYLCGYQGWALYCDSDFLWRADVAELFALARDEYAVMVVQHKYIAQAGPKMEGQINAVYPRKNWSSLMLLNCGHPANRELDLLAVNTWHRDRLHGFCWLLDELIGALPFEWNWLQLEPRAVHFTKGTPDMQGYRDTPYADEWHGYLEGSETK